VRSALQPSPSAFHRDRLADWRAVEGGIDRLIERWRPTDKSG
jgi:hypothetical protein